MKCMSCDADIPPQWVAAIAKNECPGCSGQIMTDESVELMSELSEAMALMPNNPQGLAGWLLTHYTLRKIGTAEPVPEFHTKSHRGRVLEDGSVQALSDEETSEFAKRAGVPRNVSEIEQKLKQSRKSINPAYNKLLSDIMEAEEIENEIGRDGPEYTDDYEEYEGSGVVTPEKLVKMTKNSGGLVDESHIDKSTENKMHLDRVRAQQRLKSGFKIGGSK